MSARQPDMELAMRASRVISRELKALRARLAQAEALLRQMEWEGSWQPNYHTCPICAGYFSSGHEGDCELAAFLKGASDGS